MATTHDEAPKALGHKAIKNVKGVPDWLAEQLENALYKHMIDCSMVLHALEDDRLAES